MNNGVLGFCQPWGAVRSLVNATWAAVKMADQKKEKQLLEVETDENHDRRHVLAQQRCFCAIALGACSKNI